MPALSIGLVVRVRPPLFKREFQMRATISVEEKRGFFSTSWTVRCHVEFSHVEQTVIRQANLGDRAIYQDMGEEVTLRQSSAGAPSSRGIFPRRSARRKTSCFSRMTCCR